MKNEINPEILSNRPTHLFNGNLVKIFKSTQVGNTVTGEILSGESKGKWTTVFLDKAFDIEEKICFWEDSSQPMCRRCWECKEHYR